MPGGLVLRGERVTLRLLQMAKLEAVFEGLRAHRVRGRRIASG
ncbi:MAG: hypothetical protein ABR569_14680 [Gaiellaceae bacterium]